MAIPSFLRCFFEVFSFTKILGQLNWFCLTASAALLKPKFFAVFGFKITHCTVVTKRERERETRIYRLDSMCSMNFLCKRRRFMPSVWLDYEAKYWLGGSRDDTRRLLISWELIFSSKSSSFMFLFCALSLTKAGSLAHLTMKQIIHTVISSTSTTR